MNVVSTYAQSLHFIATSLDAGNFEAAYEIVYEFKAVNQSEQRLFILKTDAPNNCKVQYEKKSVIPGDSVSIFVTYRVQRSGNISERLSLFTSDSNEPQTLIIKANVKELAIDRLQACHPDVNQKKRSSVLQLTENLVRCSITVIDSSSKKLIRNATLKLSDGTHIKEANTGAWGQYDCEITRGIITIQASKNAYVTKAIRTAISNTNTNIIVELVLQNEVPMKDVSEANNTANSKRLDDDSTQETKEKYVRNEVPISREEVTQNTTNTLLATEELPLDKYKPNHLVFLIDKSASMRENNKLDRVKESVKCLASHLRSCDYFSLIVYDVVPVVVFEKQKASNLLQVYQKIDSIEAHKQTVGSKAIIKAYQVGLAHYMSDANNEIIMSTDGAFKLEEDLLKSLSAAPNNKIKLSVLSFDTTTPDYFRLLKLTHHTKGNVIQVKDLNGLCDLILDEVKSKSLIQTH
jgi:Mg-chelatase subunit ChlD